MNKKVKFACVLAGIGIFDAAAMRCVQMLCFFDYDTGFVTDSGLLTYIYCGAAIGVSLLCMLLCRVDKKLCARIGTKRNAAAGASALLMCVFLFLCGSASAGLLLIPQQSADLLCAGFACDDAFAVCGLNVAFLDRFSHFCHYMADG